MAILRKTLRGQNAVENIFEVWLALAGILSGFVFFYEPAAIDGNALSRTIGYWPSLAWTVAYFASGVLLIYGLFRVSPRWEIFGLFLYGSAAVANGLAIINVFGTRGVATTALYLSLSAAAWVRAVWVWHVVLQLAEDHQNVP